MPPLLPHFLVYCGGILATASVPGGFLFPGFLPLATVLGGLFLFFRGRRFRVSQPILLLVIFCLGGLSPRVSEWTRPPTHIFHHLQEKQWAAVEGRLEQSPLVRSDRIQYIVELDRIRYEDRSSRVTGTARINFYFPDEDRWKETARPGNDPFHRLKTLGAGDRVRFDRVRLKRPRNFKNPGRFDYARYLASQGIDVIGGTSHPEIIHARGRFPLSLPVKLRSGLRDRFLQTLDRLFPGESGALLKALLLGEKYYLSEERRQDYIDTGLAHLMAVSGLHIGFVAGAVYVLFWPLVFYGCLRWRPEWAAGGKARKITASLCVMPVLFYLVLVGTKISALRAGIMILACLLAVLLDRDRNLFNALLVAAIGLLAWDPHALSNVGFQLSFASVTGILGALHLFRKSREDPVQRLGDPRGWQKWMAWSVPVKNGSLPGWVRIRSAAWNLILGCGVVSLIVLVVTLPLMIFHFNRVSLVGVFLNLLLVPLASLLIPLALMVSTLGLAGPGPGDVLALPVSTLTRLFLAVPEKVAAWPFASIHMATPPDLWFVLYYGGLFGLIAYFRKRGDPADPPAASRKRTRPAAVALGLTGVWLAVWLLWPRFPALPSEQLTVSILDVGQGESIFVEFPNRETLLIDGGGFYKNILDIGQLVVAPFLWHQHLNRLDYLVATHSDHDHISGLESLLEVMPVEHYLDGFPNTADRRLRHLHRKALEQNADRILLRAGIPLKIGEARLIPLNPDADGMSLRPVSRLPKEGNEQSLVLRLEYREFSMLLTGDIGESTETRLVGGSRLLNADILKGPHHGSRYSNSPPFIRAVSPRAVIFSSGYLNPMHHPHPQVIDRYQNAGIRIWRTDRDGAIRITSDGFHHKIKSYGIR